MSCSRPRRSSDAEGRARNPGAWRPLGRLLVDERLPHEGAELRKALAEDAAARAAAAGYSARSSSRKASSPASHSPGPSPSRTASSSVPRRRRAGAAPCSAPRPPSHMTYQVCVIAYDPRHRAQDVHLRERELPRSRRLRGGVRRGGRSRRHRDPPRRRQHPRDRVDIQRQPRRGYRGVEKGPRGDLRLRPDAVGLGPRLVRLKKAANQPILSRMRRFFLLLASFRVGRRARACGRPGLLARRRRSTSRRSSTRVASSFPLLNTTLDAQGGLRLTTNGTPGVTPWDTHTDFDNGITFQSVSFPPVGVSTLDPHRRRGRAPRSPCRRRSCRSADAANPVLGPTASTGSRATTSTTRRVQKVGATYVMWYSGTAEDG